MSASKKSEVQKLNYKKNFSSRAAAEKELDNIILSLQYKGFLLATIDSVQQNGNQLLAFVSENQLFKLAYLKLGNLNPYVASKAGISEKLLTEKPFQYKEIAKSFEKILVYYENNGYPFATVKIDSVLINENILKGVLDVQKNKLFKIDSIKIEGSAKVKKDFLYRYLGIKEGMPYNEDVLKKISKNVKQLPFVTEKQTQVVRLSNKTNKLYLFLDKKNASQFDGIVGVLPDANTNKTVITGDVKLKLINGIFRNGETFDIQWRRLQSQTQDFFGKLIYPYLFGTSIGGDYSLKIYRKDTSFVDINNGAAIHYYFSGLNYLKVAYKQRNTNLISTTNLAYINTLPEYADMVTKSYGLGLNFDNLDYRFNPHKGIALVINGQTGTRTIKQNPNINDAVYKDLQLKTTQYQFESTIAGYINLSGHHVLKIANQAAAVVGNSVIFRNELFRIGGLRTLRGFDEESIYASTLVIQTVEYRYLFAQNSHLLLFADGAWYENVSNSNYINDMPLSFGGGFSFETKAGILSLSYALGKQFSNSFDLRSGKIHFGLSALF